MRMISYAQNREDVLLDRAFPGEKGFYVDVGASDPVSHSVTKWFYDRGWSGVNVEPQKETFALLEADRPRDVNLNVAVSDKPGTAILYEIPDTVGLDTLDPSAAGKVRAEGRPVVESETTCITLADVFDRHVGDRAVNFLKVDAEGHERAVLAGMDFTRWRPRVLVVEATEPCSPVPCHDKWEDLILPYRYQFAFFDGLNRYYVRDEDADLIPVLAVPANVFDDFVPHPHLTEVKDWVERVLVKSRETDGLRFELSGVRAEFEAAQRELAGVRTDLEAARGNMAAVRADLEAVRVGCVNRQSLSAALAVLGEARVHLEVVRRKLLLGHKAA